MNAEEVAREREEKDAAGKQNLTGSEPAGQDGSIPSSADGVGIGAHSEANTFEPEEDPDATNGDATP